MAGAGYTPAQIDCLTLHDVKILFRRWREFPPPNEALRIVAQCLGAKFSPIDPDPDAPPIISRELVEAQRRDIMKAHGGAIPPMIRPGAP